MGTKAVEAQLPFSGPPTGQRLPIEEILAATRGGAKVAFGENLDVVPKNLTAVEISFASTLFEYLTSDPTQRTFENVLHILAYSYIGLCEDFANIPADFDFGLLGRIEASQLNAAFALLGIFVTHTPGFHPEIVQKAAQMSAGAMARAIAYRETSVVRGQRIAGGRARAKKDPKNAAMIAIHAEFVRWQDGEAKYKNDAAFATAMHAKHSDTIQNEGSIKNKCTDWRKERKKSSN